MPLQNLVLAKGSKAEENSFDACALLQDRFDRFGEVTDNIVAGLVARFDCLPVHRLCYDHSSTTAQELCRCIETLDYGSPLVDRVRNDSFPCPLFECQAK